MNRICTAFVTVFLVAGGCLAGEVQTFTYKEPFGLAHQNVILEFDLDAIVEPGNVRLLDGDGREIPCQIGRNGKKLLLRTDLAAHERRTWRLVAGKPADAGKGAVKVVENGEKGWYEITNGLTGVRIPLANRFVDETVGLSADDIAFAEQHMSHPDRLRETRGITLCNPAPLQGVQLRDGTWTANGPNVLHTKAFCCGVKVEFVEKGPFEVVVRLHYSFKGKPAIPRHPDYPDRSPGYPGGEGHYTCTISVLADEPSIVFEEDSDVVTSWRMNLFPELRPDTARHPERQQDGRVEEVDFSIPYDADYHTSYQTRDKGIIHLMPWGWYGGEYYWMLFNSSGGNDSPVMAVFADKSGNSVDADASGPGLVSSNNWMGTDRKGSGFNVQIGRGTPDARSFPFVRLRWGLYVGTKGKDIAPLSETQPIVAQMNLHGGMVPQLRHVTADIPHSPRLDWEERSDWINVKTKVTPKAVGNGIADDTDAIQAAINSLKPEGYDTPKTIYLPPGTYRITRTLRWEKLYGPRIIGHGRDTRIVWDGDGSTPPVMFHSNGVTAGVLFEGIVWDGAGKAEVAVAHASANHYESHVTHRNEAFYNLDAGIVTSHSAYFEVKQATAEVLFDNCLFVNTGSGVAFGSYNALDNTVIDCGFYYCGRAIHNAVGNVYIRRCHFEGSLDADIYTHVGDSAARRCTSIGSKRFLHAGGNMFVMQDCHVDGWTSNKGAVSRVSGAPLTLIDCTFTHPPDEQAPVQGRSEHPVLISNCASPGTDGVLDEKHFTKAIHIPAGKRGPAVKSARQRFFRSEVPVPGKVFDARRDFGAVGDGKTDDTEAILATINAARKYGNGAIAYLPHGRYRVTKTIDVFGEEYYIGGAGLCWQAGTEVMRGGARPEAGQEVAVFHVENANNVVIQDLKATTPSVYVEDEGVISVLHTASDMPSLVTYNDVGGLFEFRGLSTQDRVNAVTINGVAHFDDCQRARIRVEQFYPSRHPQSKRFNTVLRVRGRNSQARKDGLLGIMTMFNSNNPYDIIVEDSQDLVISDYYTEQTERVLLLSDNPGDTPGRVTIQAHKFQGFAVADMAHVRNYKGAFFLGATFTPQPPVPEGVEVERPAYSMRGTKHADQPLVFSHEGENPIDIMLVGCSYRTGKPVLRGGSGATFIVGNDVATGVQGPWHTDLSDNEKAKIGKAFEHLRELGEMDLQFRRLTGRQGRQPMGAAAPLPAQDCQKVNDL